MFFIPIITWYRYGLICINSDRAGKKVIGLQFDVTATIFSRNNLEINHILTVSLINKKDYNIPAWPPSQFHKYVIVIRNQIRESVKEHDGRALIYSIRDH